MWGCDRITRTNSNTIKTWKLQIPYKEKRCFAPCGGINASSFTYHTFHEIPVPREITFHDHVSTSHRLIKYVCHQSHDPVLTLMFSRVFRPRTFPRLKRRKSLCYEWMALSNRRLFRRSHVSNREKRCCFTWHFHIENLFHVDCPISENFSRGITFQKNFYAESHISEKFSRGITFPKIAFSAITFFIENRKSTPF